MNLSFKGYLLLNGFFLFFISLNNVFNFNLIDLLNSNLAVKRRELTSKCSCTHPCHLSDSMAYDSKFLKEYFKN